jgi:AcrR family transcriptional regulator
MTPRPNMDHIRKPQILDAAGEVITERGLAGARIADIADRAGTSPPAVLYWFEDREQLLNEALGWSEDRFYDSLTERLDSVDTPAQRLRLLFEASAEDPDWTLWMELWARALRDEQARKTRLRLDARWRDEIAALVTAGQATGEFDGARDADEIALLLASLLDGLALQATLDDPSVDAKRVRDLLIEAAGRLLGTELPDIDERTTNRGHEALAEGG